MENKTETALIYIHDRAKKENAIYLQGMIDMAFLAGLIGINEKRDLVCLYCENKK